MNSEFTEERNEEEINFAEHLSEEVEEILTEEDSDIEVFDGSKLVKNLTGYVNAGLLHVRENPTKSADSIRIIPRGSMLFCFEGQDLNKEWVKVVIVDGTVGYVMSEFVDWIRNNNERDEAFTRQLDDLYQRMGIK